MTFVYLTVIAGTVARHEQDHPLTLEEMQAIVGGNIELFARYDGERPHTAIDCYCNEEGKLIDLPLNVYWPAGADFIRGPVLVVGGDERTGDNRSLTASEVGRVQAYRVGQSMPILFVAAPGDDAEAEADVEAKHDLTK